MLVIHKSPQQAGCVVCNSVEHNKGEELKKNFGLFGGDRPGTFNLRHVSEAGWSLQSVHGISGEQSLPPACCVTVCGWMGGPSAN